MKVVVVGTRGFPGVQGGVEKHCEQLYLQLARKACDITVYAREAYLNYKSDTYRGIRLIPVSCPDNKFLEAIVHTFKCVLMARKIKPDILHIHAIGPSLFAPFARILGMKVVVTHHGPDYMREKWTLPAKVFLKICERMGMVFADKIITIAGNIANDVKQKYGRSSTIIPNGVNIPETAQTVEYLKKYELDRKWYILAVGRFVPEKGFDDLIDAFNQSELEKWKLVIVGDADHEDQYSRNLKAKAAGNDSIVLTGFITGDPLQELYSHAGLFVLPSYYEGLPIVLLEAMSYGLSCIASDIQANRNVQLDDDRFFEVGDIGLLTIKLIKYVNSTWENKDKIEQINMISERYNWEHIADQTMKVYREIVN